MDNSHILDQILSKDRCAAGSLTEVGDGVGVYLTGCVVGSLTKVGDGVGVYLTGCAVGSLTEVGDGVGVYLTGQQTGLLEVRLGNPAVEQLEADQLASLARELPKHLQSRAVQHLGEEAGGRGHCRREREEKRGRMGGGKSG